MSTPLKRQPRAGRVGRPPAGDRGERVKDYPQVSFRLPKAARDKLVALSTGTQAAPVAAHRGISGMLSARSPASGAGANRAPPVQQTAKGREIRQRPVFISASTARGAHRSTPTERRANPERRALRDLSASEIRDWSPRRSCRKSVIATVYRAETSRRLSRNHPLASVARRASCVKETAGAPVCQARIQHGSQERAVDRCADDPPAERENAKTSYSVTGPACTTSSMRTEPPFRIATSTPPASRSNAGGDQVGQPSRLISHGRFTAVQRLGDSRDDTRRFESALAKCIEGDRRPFLYSALDLCVRRNVPVEHVESRCHGGPRASHARTSASRSLRCARSHRLSRSA